MAVPIQTRAFVIYVFGPCPDGRFYVGQTENLQRRFRSHAKAQGECPEFHKAVQRFGVQALPLQVVAETDVAEEADRLESLFITKFNSLVPHGYNLTLGGRGVRFLPGAKVVGFLEHPVESSEFRDMAQRMADGSDSDFSNHECPCCGGWNNGFSSCDCGVAPAVTRWLLGYMAAGSTFANIPLCEDPKLIAKWRSSRDADFFLLCEKRGVKGRTILGVGPVALQKYAARFWPYLESAVRRRCLVSKSLPSYQLGKFRPLPEGKVVETAKIKIERLLRRSRRELGPGEPNIEVFARILTWQKPDSGKIFEAVLATFIEHGGSEAEVIEARRRVALYRELERELPAFRFLSGDLAYVSFDGNDWLAYIQFSSRASVEDPIMLILKLPEQDRRQALMHLIESPPENLGVRRLTYKELNSQKGTAIPAKDANGLVGSDGIRSP